MSNTGTDITAVVDPHEKAVPGVPSSSTPAHFITTESAVTDPVKVPPSESVYYHLKT